MTNTPTITTREETEAKENKIEHGGRRMVSLNALSF
jgi:hypothetical protein